MSMAKEKLEKQLQLLSERSLCANDNDLVKLTREMINLALILDPELKNQSGDVQGYLATVQLSAKELADICVGQYERVRYQTKPDRKKSEYLEQSS